MGTMSVFTGFVLYFLIWWVIIFCVLPLNIRSIKNTGDGNMPGAPEDPGLKRKFILTTIISFFVWVIVFLIIRYGGISFQDMADRMAR